MNLERAAENDQHVNEYPIHYATGLPMAPCPSCGKLSGLSGVDGRECLGCMVGYEDEHVEADHYWKRPFFRRLVSFLAKYDHSGVGSEPDASDGY